MGSQVIKFENGDLRPDSIVLNESIMSIDGTNRQQPIDHDQEKCRYDIWKSLKEFSDMVVEKLEVLCFSSVYSSAIVEFLKGSTSDEISNDRQIKFYINDFTECMQALLCFGKYDITQWVADMRKKAEHIMQLIHGLRDEYLVDAMMNKRSSGSGTEGRDRTKIQINLDKAKPHRILIFDKLNMIARIDKETIKLEQVDNSITDNLTPEMFKNRQEIENPYLQVSSNHDHKANAEAKKLKLMIEELEKTNKLQSDKINSLEYDLTGKSSLITGLEDDIANNINEIKMLNDRIRELKEKMVEMKVYIQEKDARYGELKEKMNEMKVHIQEKDARYEDLKYLSQQDNARLEQERQSLLDKLEKLTVKSRNAKAKLTSLENENKSLTTQLNALAENLDVAKTNIAYHKQVTHDQQHIITHDANIKAIMTNTIGNLKRENKLQAIHIKNKDDQVDIMHNDIVDRCVAHANEVEKMDKVIRGLQTDVFAMKIWRNDNHK